MEEGRQQQERGDTHTRIVLEDNGMPTREGTRQDEEGSMQHNAMDAGTLNHVQGWEMNQGQGDMDLALDLTLPIVESTAITASPTIYSSASDSSLIGPRGLGGMWKMTITDDNLGFDDLDIDDMLVDQSIMTGMLEDVLNNEHCKEGQDEGQEKAKIVENATEKPLYKQAALKDLQIVDADIDEPERGRLMKEGQGSEIVSANLNKEEGGNSSKGKAAVDLGADIDMVMKKVEAAMASVRNTEGSKKMKKVIESSTTEVQKLVSKMNEEDDIDAMMINEDGSVMVLSSGSSGEMGDKKRKRKNAMPKRMGSVASRLRKKETVREVEEEVNKVTNEATKMIPKMAVRKIKVSAKKAATSLTLAPPTLGLPLP